jgi:hypothetical protein
VPTFDWKIDVDGIQLFTKNLIADCKDRCEKIACVNDLTIENVLHVKIRVLHFTKNYQIC